MNNNNIIDIVLSLIEKDATNDTENYSTSYCTILTESRYVSDFCSDIRCTNCPLSYMGIIKRMYEK